MMNPGELELIKLMVIDDNDQYRSMLSELLKQFRTKRIIALGTFPDIFSALEQFESLRPDLVVLFYPSWAGDEWKTMTNLLMHVRDVKILAVTGQGLLTEMETTLRMGAAGVVVSRLKSALVEEAIRMAAQGLHCWSDETGGSLRRWFPEAVAAHQEI